MGRNWAELLYTYLLHLLRAAYGTSRRCGTVGFRTIAAMRRVVAVAIDP